MSTPHTEGPLDLVHARLTAHLLEVVGPRLTAAGAEAALRAAKAWSPQGARALDDHLAEQPDALNHPSGHCPRPLVALQRALKRAGFGDAVAQLACATCGNDTRNLFHPTPAGRICDLCHLRTTHKPCARCGKVRQMVAKRPEGSICKPCRSFDPTVTEECAGCGRVRVPATRNEDGRALCQSCLPRPRRRCIGCGTNAPAQAITDDGPVCSRCYRAPERLCGKCGNVRRVGRRGTDGHPDICQSCNILIKQCSICGRTRRGNHLGGDGPFQCDTCHDRPRRTCGICGRHKRTRAFWPVGSVCSACHLRHRSNPRPCSGCGDTQVLVGRSAEGGGLCGPCSGGPTWACTRCGFPGDLFTADICSRCICRDRVGELLAGPDGEIVPQLVPLADALTSARGPRAVMHWLQRSPSAHLLNDLAKQRVEITHDILDQLPQGHRLRYVRDALILSGVLPERNEPFHRTRLWIAAELATTPAHQTRVLRPFAEWDVVRRGRRSAARNRYTFASGTHDRHRFRAARTFLDWLDEHDIELAQVTQSQVDLWLSQASPSHRDHLKAFVNWTNARRLTSSLKVPRRPQSAQPVRFLTDEEHEQRLRRCLNDDSIPIDVRVIGALFALYGLSLVRITQLTRDRFISDAAGHYLVIDRHPVLLPPKLAGLIRLQLDRPAELSMVFKPTGQPTDLIFPGRPPNRPLSASWLQTQLRKHGLFARAARNNAMLELITSMPGPVVSDLLGVHPSTATNWANYAQDSWADYLAARDVTSSDQE